MFIVVVDIDLYFFESNSLKEKRSILKSITKRIQNKFNVTIAEVDYMNDYTKGCIAIGNISNDKKYSNKVLQKIINKIDQEYEVEVTNINWTSY